jgi:hypothetical protein
MPKYKIINFVLISVGGELQQNYLKPFLNFDLQNM